jgi:hypothetical protein
VGPVVKQQRAQLKKKIIREISKPLAIERKRSAKNAKSAAGELFDDVNLRLKASGLSEIAENTLADELHPLIQATSKM